jgi:hypothetical protein
MDFQEKGGVKKISKSDIDNYTNIVFSKFIKSRTSVRNFQTQMFYMMKFLKQLT